MCNSIVFCSFFTQLCWFQCCKPDSGGAIICFFTSARWNVVPTWGNCECLSFSAWKWSKVDMLKALYQHEISSSTCSFSKTLLLKVCFKPSNCYNMPFCLYCVVDLLGMIATRAKVYQTGWRSGGRYRFIDSGMTTLGSGSKRALEQNFTVVSVVALEI